MATVPSLTEAQFTGWLLDLARTLGWKTCHFHDSRREAGGKLVGDKDSKGWPDVVLYRQKSLKAGRGKIPVSHPFIPVRLIFAELKTGKRKVTPEQDEWLEALRQVALRNPGVEVYVWRPEDRDEIEHLLR